MSSLVLWVGEIADTDGLVHRVKAVWDKTMGHVVIGTVATPIMVRESAADREGSIRHYPTAPLAIKAAKARLSRIRRF